MAPDERSIFCAIVIAMGGLASTIMVVVLLLVNVYLIQLPGWVQLLSFLPFLAASAFALLNGVSE